MEDLNEHVAFCLVVTNGSAMDFLARLCILVLTNKVLHYDT